MSRRQPPRALRVLIALVKEAPSRLGAQANGTDIAAIDPRVPTPDPFEKAQLLVEEATRFARDQ